MLKSRSWIGIFSTPIIMASVGCSISQRPYANTNRGLSPERLMAMAQTFERQGHLAQAKNAYFQILAVKPDFPNAQQRLETLIASEHHQNPSELNIPLNQPAQIATRATQTTKPVETVAALETPSRQLAPKPPAQTEPIAAVETKTDRLSQATPATQAPVAPVIEVALEDEPRKLAIPELVDTPRSVITHQAQTATVREINREPSAVPEIPELLTSTISLDEVRSDVNNAAESSEFFEPLVERIGERPQSFDAGLDKYFGTFHIGMVAELKIHRENIQPRLAEIARNQEAECEKRSRAIFLLGAIGPDAKDVVPTLRNLMHNDQDPYLRVDLSEAILKIQPEDTDAISVLVDGLKDSDQSVRWVSAFALRSAVSPRTTFVIESLRETLKTDDDKLRRMVFLTLAEFGPAAAVVVPELEAALHSSDPATRDVAKASLECIAPDRKTASNLRLTSNATSVAVVK